MNDNLVKSLREKTGDADLDTILKTTLGGYSRKSVQEYITMMRQQQYDMQRSFSEEMQLMQAERDKLARKLAEANERAETAEKTLEQAEPLMKKAADLEKDMDEAVERIQADTARMEQLTRELEEQKAEVQQGEKAREELQTRLEQSESEIRMLKLELGRCAAEPEVQDAESPAEKAEARGITGLTDGAETTQVQMEILVRERETIEKRMESVIRQEKILFQALNECRAELENRRDQNQCIEAENKELSQRLSEQMWQNISLNREITHMRTMNESLKRKLETALEESAKGSSPTGLQDMGDMVLWALKD